MDMFDTAGASDTATMNTRQKGAAGEDAAAEYLLANGYRIANRNYRTRYGEIDCVAEAPDGTMVFVEVKASWGRTCGNPMFWVTPAKQRQIMRMAQAYRARHNAMNRPCRFDVIAIKGSVIDHLKNAFIRM